MKHFGNEFRLGTIIILIASISTIGMAPLQDAWAMPGPLCSIKSVIVAVDSFNSWQCWGQAGQVAHKNMVFVMSQTIDEDGNADTGINFVNGATGDCSGVDGNGDSNIEVTGSGGTDGNTNAFLLADSTGLDNTNPERSTPNFGEVPNAGTIGVQTDDSVKVSFPEDPNTSNLFDTTAAAFFSATMANTEWFQIGDGPSTPSVLEGAWTFETCVLDEGIGIGGGDFDGYIAEPAVAGEIIPISTTALLIAGFNTSAMWMLPALAIIGGAAFTVLRFQAHRK